MPTTESTSLSKANFWAAYDTLLARANADGNPRDRGTG